MKIHASLTQSLKKFSISYPKILLQKKKSPKDFTRERGLPFAALIVFVLSLTSSGKSSGVDTKSGLFFKNARRSGVWPNAEAVYRSAVSKARKKVPWETTLPQAGTRQVR